MGGRAICACGARGRPTGEAGGRAVCVCGSPRGLGVRCVHYRAPPPGGSLGFEPDDHHRARSQARAAKAQLAWARDPCCAAHSLPIAARISSIAAAVGDRYPPASVAAST